MTLIGELSKLRFVEPNLFIDEAVVVVVNVAAVVDVEAVVNVVAVVVDVKALVVVVAFVIAVLVVVNILDAIVVVVNVETVDAIVHFEAAVGAVVVVAAIDNVSKGTNVTIYCILRQLESFHIRHGCYPETLYLQVDGGSENANHYLLALLELFAVKRCCREVYYTRLHAGHTHEDNDAAYEVIWACFRAVACLTTSQ